MSWRRLNGSRILLPIKEAVEKTIEKELAAGHQLKICIGTDSQVRGKNIGFATVIVFLREGKGGFMFINSEVLTQKMEIRERMIREVSKSVTLAYELSEIWDQYDIALEIHADINTDASFKSNIALKEAMGYIKGMGYEFKAKPNAFASSSCADKVC
ncbi:ribonuclease H-like YkuK family protein [Aureispira anguillae]|uniref:Ribonuclease H-like YkuK family protein n=1 Tax=Aureispira anguillae TaxID=2864201 RepID=A0A916DV67_9BACT|nr:ribonuclease H-like YkuK family protein [Aureispira anguillae]BDS14814.1 ribonuclease H-like YkuK family protein [Aureispira anguillae]